MKRKAKTEKIPEQNIQYSWDNYKRCNIHVVGIPEGEGRERGTGEVFAAIMTEKFPKLMSDTKPCIQEA